MKISIVTPSYNQGIFIGRTLQSVAKQRDTLPAGVELEHVVFDGGSNDTTVEVLKRHGDAIRWISETDRGQTDAVNKGIRATDGEIVGWLNSDDVYYDGALASVLAYFEAHPDVDLVYGMADHIDQQDHAFEDYPTEPWDFDRLKQTCFICQPALFFRRRVFEQYGLLDESLNYCMDYEFWLRLGKAGAKFGYLERKLAGSRLYADNKTLGARVKVHAEINDMFKAKFGQVPRRWIANYAHAVVGNKVVRAQHPRRFLIMLLLWSNWAAFHWNRRVFW
jgi:glycosyltransferase involved in cell wall biosynthesis